MTNKDKIFYALLATFGVTLAWAIFQIFVNTPSAQLQAGGLAQKIFYFHVPVANGVYLAGGACFIASAIYLVNREPVPEALDWMYGRLSSGGEVIGSGSARRTTSMSVPLT